MRRFFIIGFQRSGTTLLDYLVNEHPEVVSVSEWELLCMIYFGQKKRLRDVEFDSFVKIKKDHDVNQEGYLKLVELYLKRKMSTRTFIEKAYDLCKHSNNVKALGGKEAISLTHHRYGFMKKLYKDFGKSTSIIFIERDIKGVLNSYMKLGFFPIGNRKLNENNLKEFVKKYVKCINYMDRIISKFIHVIYLEYEDLMENPKTQLMRVSKILGVDSSDHMLNNSIITNHKKTSRIDFKGIRPGLKDAWKESLSSEVIEFLNRYFKKNRKRYASASF